MNFSKVICGSIAICLMVPAPHAEAKSRRKPSTHQRAKVKPKPKAGLTTGQKQAASDALKELRKLAAAVKVGLNQEKYSDRVIDAKASVEDSLAKLPAGALKKEIQASMQAYEDANTLWSESLSTDFVGGYYEDMQGIYKRYGVEVSKPTDRLIKLSEDPFVRLDYVTHPMQVVWSAASSHLQSASALVK